MGTALHGLSRQMLLGLSGLLRWRLERGQDRGREHAGGVAGLASGLCPQPPPSVPSRATGGTNELGNM